MADQINILIVEDESHIALALKTILRQAIHRSNVVSVYSAQQAVEALAVDKYDLLISDWNMPRMTGLELLSRVRADKHTAQLPFLMLTARADMGSVKNALEAGVTDYIAKPFIKSLLIEKVKKLLDPSHANSARKSAISEKQSGLLETIAAKIKEGSITVPILPEIAFKAVEVINSDDSSLEDVTDIIKIDTGLTSKIIAVANSPNYRTETPIQDLQHAISHIGLRDSGNIILMYSTRGLFNVENKSFEKRQRILWEHALATATGARLIGKKLKHSFPERLYTAGLLHDMGKVLLLHVLMELQEIRDDMTETAIDEILDVLHVDCGVTLLKHWKFPAKFIEVARHHHDFEKMRDTISDTHIVSYANLLTRQMGMSLHPADKDAAAMQLLGEQLDIDEDQIDTMIEEIASYVHDIKNRV